MKQTLQYSVLRYSPSVVSGESINLGMIICAEEGSYREFYYTKKISRILNFDDMVSKNVIEKMLQSIKDEVEGNLFTESHFDIEEYTRFYTNSYCFEKPRTLLYDSLDTQVEELKKTYFRFDFPSVRFQTTAFQAVEL